MVFRVIAPQTGTEGYLKMSVAGDTIYNGISCKKLELKGLRYSQQVQNYFDI